MATPNTSLSQVGISDVNVEYNFSANTPRAFNDVFFRNLTGNSSKLIANTPISISDVSDKAAYDGVLGTLSVDNSDFGTVVSQTNLSVDSDIISPDVTWSYTVVSGSGNISLSPDGGKNALLRIVNDTVGVVQANIAVTANVSFQGKFIGSDTKYVNLRAESFNPNLVVSGIPLVNNSGYTAQTAVTQITATSNVATGSIRFRTSPPNGGSVNGNTITFSSTADSPGVDNNNIYTLTTELLYQNVVIDSNTTVVNTRAVFLQPDLNISFGSFTNNVFANSGPVESSMTLTASHSVSGANVYWSQVVVSGDTPTLTVAANSAFANVSLSVPTFGAKKTVVDVKASLQYANGYVLNEKTNRITLRAAGYGLSFSPAQDLSVQGYAAQTATTSASATFRAGTFTWDTATVSGSPATLTQSVGQNTASISVTTTAATPGIVNSSTRINAILSFDGVPMANQSSITTTSAEYTAYSFDLVGPSVNTQVGEGTINTSLLNQATHTVANGYVVWSVNSANVQISSNTSAANVYLSTTTISAQTANLSAKLYDQFNRFVAEKAKTVTLRAFAPNIRFLGANTSSKTGYAPPQSATTSIDVVCDTGANSFASTTALLSGSPLSISNAGSNTTYSKLSFTASANTIGTVSGSYRITSTVNYFGTTFSKTFDVSASASLLDSNFSLTAQNGQANGTVAPVTAVANAVASYSVPGGYIQWSRVIVSGNVLDVPVANNSLYQFRVQRTTSGTTNTVVNVTGTLLDSTGAVVKAITIPVSASATVFNSQLTISGANNVSVSNTFQAVASSTLTASVAAGIAATFQWSATKVSGSTASFSSSGNQATISLQADGVQTLSAVYDVTTNCVVDGQVVSTKVTRVTLNASALSPTINFNSSNSSVADFNFPIDSVAVVNASMSPAEGTIEWIVTKVSGDTLVVSPFVDRIEIKAVTSNIGVVSGTYDVTANYKTPNGTLITSRTARVVASAERYNPAFAWTSITANPLIQRGWEETIVASALVSASSNSSLSGQTYSITAQKVSGVTANVNISSNSVTLDVSNNRTTEGTAEKTAVYDVTCSLIKNSQTLAGPFTRRVTVTTAPYYLILSPLYPSGESTDEPATASTTALSNHESFAGTPLSWSRTLLSGGLASFSYSSGSGGSNNVITGNLTPPASAGTRTATIELTANFMANGSTRTASTTMYLQATSSIDIGPACVAEDMYMSNDVVAAQVNVGEQFVTWSPETGFETTAIESIGYTVLQPCVEIRTQSGAVLRCSKSTPFNLETAKTDLDEGHFVYAEQLAGRRVLVNIYNETFWDEVVSVEDIGTRKVVPISFGGKSFAAGESNERMIFSHNMAKAG